MKLPETHDGRIELVLKVLKGMIALLVVYGLIIFARITADTMEEVMNWPRWLTYGIWIGNIPSVVIFTI